MTHECSPELKGKFKMECTCCHESAVSTDLTQCVLNIKHPPQCDANIGAPWHPECVHDPRFCN